MAAGNFTAYHNGLLVLANQTVDFVNDTIEARLLDEDYTPTAATDAVWSDISTDEIGDADYTKQVLANCAISLTGGKVRYDCDDIDFGDSVTITAKWLVIIAFDSGTEADSELLWYIDLNTASSSATVSSTNDDFDLAISANGIYQLTP